MVSEIEQLNDRLRRGALALFDSLSSVGRNAIYPRDIPFQAEQARGARLNATIGQMTDGHGSILQVPALVAPLGSMADEELNLGLSYSPIGGLPELRDHWCRWQRPAGEPRRSLPLVTCGLTHGLALCADLFGGPGRRVLVPRPGWGNYRQVFGLRTGAEMIEVSSYREGRWQPEAMARAVSQLDGEDPVVLLLNLPSNPGGYMPTREQRQLLIESLLGEAESRPMVVLCDDAYSGLVHDQDVPSRSLFWDLCGAHENVVAVRLAGSTKELSFFGGRVGFLTFDVDPGAEAAQALESKLMCLVRAGIGSPPALSQVVLLHALQSASIDAEVEQLRQRMKRRHRALSQALTGIEERSGGRLRALPCNAGVFALLELTDGSSAEALRVRLLEEQSTGVVAIADRYVRLAFCSVASESLAEVVERVERALSPE